MTSIATTVIVIGVLFGIAGWLASPTGSARATRRCLAPALRELPRLRLLRAGGHRRHLLPLGADPEPALLPDHPGDRRPRRLRHPRAAQAGARGIPRRHLRRALRPDQGPRRRRGQESANIGERASKLRLPEVRRPEAATAAAARPADDRGRAASRASSASAPCTRRASSPTRSWPPRRPACSATARATNRARLRTRTGTPRFTRAVLYQLS